MLALISKLNDLPLNPRSTVVFRSRERQSRCFITRVTSTYVI